MSSTSGRPAAQETSAAKDWLRALQLTASIPANPRRLLSTAIAEISERVGDSPALLSDEQSLSYMELISRSNQYARWSQRHGLRKGDVVALLMTNRPEYFALWLGLTSVGCVVALLNTNLVGDSLAHCIGVVDPKHLIVDADLADTLDGALSGLEAVPVLWIHGTDDVRFRSLDPEVRRESGTSLTDAERPEITIEDRALYIFTSGTTGMPKAASLSHARILQWTYWFAGLMNVGPADRLYCCLPMYHGIGGVLVPGVALAGGGSAVIRKSFSASRFWNDLVRWDCTIFQYIGEICRYLLHAGDSPDVARHRIRLACGNGLQPDVWEKFEKRFRIPRILEFFGTTEGGVSLFNVEGERGAIGRVPSYLRHRFSPALIRLDTHTSEPLRGENGFCLRCGQNEPGEALGKLVTDPQGIGSRFEGYTDPVASERKILRNVFAWGDAWVRTGDLMREDERGFFHFVDRIGDTFRWKGENVATTEVSAAVCEFPGVRHAAVYGVRVPGLEGRAGMAAMVMDRPIDLPAFRAHLTGRLPSYARPVFLRLRESLDVTGTFKYSKSDLAREGFNPAHTSDVICFDDPERGSFRRLDQESYDRIQLGRIRL
ncbi:MAG TPA: long-chain-acyl-CoA synthetase [Acidobacteriaceae bacterium]|nr:long-chain-acyl-CoA synthetase [Acidobacteriaceae bacterium]